MHLYLYIPLVVIHVAMMATWFGMTVIIPGSIRRARSAGDEAFRFSLASATRYLRIGNVAGLLTLATGLVLLFTVKNGMKSGKNYHIALTVVVLMTVLGWLVMTPILAKLRQKADNGKPAGSEIGALVKKLSMYCGIQQLA
ncbi:MAG: putative membrane protein, partial [Myxococcota bacterium]